MLLKLSMRIHTFAKMWTNMSENFVPGSAAHFSDGCLHNGSSYGDPGKGTCQLQSKITFTNISELLFLPNPLSPGSVFFLRKETQILNVFFGHLKAIFDPFQTSTRFLFKLKVCTIQTTCKGSLNYCNRDLCSTAFPFSLSYSATLLC